MPHPDPTDRKAIDDAIADLWRFYDEHAAQARQHETLRAAVITILAGFAATMVATVTGDGFARADLLPGVLIVAIGVLGCVLSMKHYERNRLHTAVLAATRAEITGLRTSLGPGAERASTQAIRTRAEKDHAATFSFFPRRGRSETSPLVAVRGKYLWLALPLLVVAAGFVVIGLAAT